MEMPKGLKDETVLTLNKRGYPNLAKVVKNLPFTHLHEISTTNKNHYAGFGGKYLVMVETSSGAACKVFYTFFGNFKTISETIELN